MSTHILPSRGASAGRGPQTAPLSKTVNFSLTLAALGVIYGDIGTSPLYTIKECFTGPHGLEVTPGNIIGVMSLILWSLIVVVSMKYVLFLLRADNRGEGGTFALLALLQKSLASSRTKWSVLTLLAATGASLLYGDGVITPSISVLSAVEGLNMATQGAKDYIVPITCCILFALFAIQQYGTAAVGRLFGPVMVVWFAALGMLGIRAISHYPQILAAINPLAAIHFFAANHLHGFIALGGVVLCITGGEALYADMGHFGPRPIRLGWYGVALPGLLLNYLGQCALLIHAPATAIANPFYALAPKPLLIPLVCLATMATIIASQAMISGVFSLTQQAVQLGFAPRIHIVHTSRNAKGQIYIPSVNWALLGGCIILILIFRESGRLAAAYGIAVTATMAITSYMYYQVTRYKWHWPLWKSASLLLLFLSFDCSFLGANLIKVTDGGWITITIAAIIACSMITWRDGRAILARYYRIMAMPADVFLHDLAEHEPPRIPGTAVFMTISPDGIPHAMVHYLKHNEALHEQILLVSIIVTETPAVAAEERVSVSELGMGIHRIVCSYGFMESPDMARIFQLLAKSRLAVDIHSASFFLGRENILPTGKSPLARWRKHLFIFMSRNAWNATSFFGLPAERVMELGNQVEI